MKHKKLAFRLAGVVSLSFAIIILASIGRELVETSEISKQREFTTLLDASGDIESLSQRLAFLTLSLLTTNNPSLKESLKEKLDLTTKSFEVQLATIVNSAYASDTILSERSTSILFQSPFSLERDLKRFVASVSKATGELENGDASGRYLLRAATHTSDVYRGLRVFRHQIATDARISLSNARNMSYALLAINIILITGLALFTLRYLVKRLESEERSREAAEFRLREQVEELQSFSGIIAHDLKGPLHNIHVSGNMALQRLSTQQREDTATKELLELIVGQSEKLSQMIQTLLEFFRKSSQPIHKKRITLQEVMAEISNRFASEIQHNRLQLKCDKSRAIYVDETLIVQIFQNLVENALKYADVETVEMTASARKVGGGQEITLSDNGKGVPANKLEKIFEPFYQADSKSDYNGGVGLGLSFVRKAVIWHGGKISASNRPGGGLRVSMTFPGE